MERKHILVVDDQASILKMVAKRLELVGFRVTVAMDGETALLKVSAERPDLIILDVTLPKLNGFDVCAQLKQDASTKAIPVVMFTSRATDTDYWKGVECGADAYLAKPFGSDELEEIVNRLVGAIRTRTEHPEAHPNA